MFNNENDDDSEDYSCQDESEEESENGGESDTGQKSNEPSPVLLCGTFLPNQCRDLSGCTTCTVTHAAAKRDSDATLAAKSLSTFSAFVGYVVL